MPFVIKDEKWNPHVHDQLPEQSEDNKAIAPGDIWQCSGCGVYWIYSPGYSYWGWVITTERRVKKELKRVAKGKPFKRQSSSLGPG